MKRLLAIVKNEEEANQRLDVLNQMFNPTGNKFEKNISGEGRWELDLVGVRLGAEGEMVTESHIKQMKDVAAGRWVPDNPTEEGKKLADAYNAADRSGRVGEKPEEDVKASNPEAQQLRSRARGLKESAESKATGQLSGASGGTDTSTAPVNTSK